MQQSSPPRSIIALCLLISCASCATKPELYQELSSSGQLRQSGKQADKKVYFNTSLDPGRLKAFTSVIVEPARIYRGRDNQFRSLSEQSKIELARHADLHFSRELASKQLLVGTPETASLRMRVTITGAEGSVPVLSTATKLTPVGFAMSGLRSVSDREGSFAGAVIYAIELFDARNGTLIYAFVTRQYPNALNIPATIRPLDAAKAGLERGAATTATALKDLMGTARDLPKT